MRRECRECRHRLQRKPLVSDPCMHHGTCVTHVPCCMSGSLIRGGGESIPGACATHNFTYLARGPWWLRNGNTLTICKGNFYVMYLMTAEKAFLITDKRNLPNLLEWSNTFNETISCEVSLFYLSKLDIWLHWYIRLYRMTWRNWVGIGWQ